MCLAEWTLALTEGMTHLCQVPGNTSSLSLNSLPCLAAVWKEKTVPTGGLGLDWEVPPEEQERSPRALDSSLLLEQSVGGSGSDLPPHPLVTC